MIKFNKLTKVTSSNAERFITLFICMPTKAIDPNLAGEFSTVSFTQALSNIVTLAGQVIQNNQK